MMHDRNNILPVNSIQHQHQQLLLSPPTPTTSSSSIIIRAPPQSTTKLIVDKPLTAFLHRPPQNNEVLHRYPSLHHPNKR
jgi:hypothetical protein